MLFYRSHVNILRKKENFGFLFKIHKPCTQHISVQEAGTEKVDRGSKRGLKGQLFLRS